MLVITTHSGEQKFAGTREMRINLTESGLRGSSVHKKIRQFFSIVDSGNIQRQPVLQVR